ncbi:hypothetical protein QOT17_021418 [Balamuthia mandrillaris]
MSSSHFCIALVLLSVALTASADQNVTENPELQRGHELSLITDLFDEGNNNQVKAQALEVLSGAPIFIVPEVEYYLLDLFEQMDMLSTYLNEGGVVVWSANLQALSATLSLGLQVVEGYPFSEEPITGDPFKKRDAAKGTPFEKGPEALGNWRYDRVVNMEADWPKEAVCIYGGQEDGVDACAVFTMPFGAGQLIYLGWSYEARTYLLPPKMEAEMEIPELMTEEWRDVFLLAVEGYVAGGSDESFAERLAPFVF